MGAGPFAQAGLNDSILFLLMFMISAVVPSLALSADVAVRRAVEEDLRRTQTELEERVQRRTAELAEQRIQLLEAKRLAKVGSWVWEIPQDQVRWSDQLMEIFGLRPEQLDGTIEDYLARIHVDDRPHMREQIAQAAADGGSFTSEARIVRPDGEIRYLQSSGQVIKEERGRPSRMLGVCQDVTDRKKAEIALRESEESQRTLFLKAPVPMHALDAERRIVEVNDRWLELFGYERAEVIGRAITDFHYPESEPRHRLRWDGLLAAGNLRDADRRYAKKSGELVETLVSATVERDSSGAFVRSISVVTDVTPRRRAEEAARRERQFSELLMESSTEGIIGLDKEFRYIVWNPVMAAMTGVPWEQRAGRHIFEAQPELVGTEIEAAWRAAMQGERTSIRDQPYDFRESGRHGFYDAEFTPVYGSDRAIVGCLAFLRDISERRHIEEQLRQAQKMEAVGQLTGGIAHDFNNLLTVIILNMEALKRRLPSEVADLGRLVDAAMQGANQAVALIRRLLVFSRRQPLDPQPIDPNELVVGMSELLGRTLGEAVEIETALADGIWRISVDIAELESALLNLVINARDAMPGGGKLTIETANAELDEDYAAGQEELSAGQYAVIAVSDSGIGMTEEIIARAFEPFFTTKEVGRGSGLGLSQVYGFVKQSGGHVQILSEPDEGTTVKLYLPRLVAADVESPGTVEAAEPPSGSRGETILVVEDDPGVRATSVEMLVELGYRVLEATDGAAALDLIEAQPGIDLLFTDIVLPGGVDGRELAVRARALDPWLKVLFTTGYARDAVIRQGKLDPGIELIAKPFNIADLGEMIRRVLEAERRSEA
jgi:PAS domain S-box-containing protein